MAAQVLAMQQAQRSLTDDDANVELGHFKITPSGLEVVGKPTLQESEVFGRRLGRILQSVAFAVGDFALWCERTFGEEAAQVIDHTVFSEDTIRAYKWLAEKVAPQDRVPQLSVRHHMAVAKLSPPQQRTWLKRALGEGEGIWPVSRLTAAIRDGGDGVVTALWLVVRCQDKADLEAVKLAMEKEGRICKVAEKREREPKKITARAKRPGRRKARSRG